MAKDIRVLKVPVSGTPEFETIVDSLGEMQRLVGGWIEPVRFNHLKTKFVMVVNEEGRLRNLPVNVRATYLVNKVANTLDNPQMVLVGDTFICVDWSTHFRSVPVGKEVALFAELNDTDVFDKWWNKGGKEGVEAALCQPLYRFVTIS